MPGRTIIALAGTAHEKKLSLLSDVDSRLHALGSTRTALEPNDINGNVIYEPPKTRLGIVRAGHDPRDPERDHLHEVLQRKCHVILYPVSLAPERQKHLALMASIYRCDVLYFDPLRFSGHASLPWHPEQAQRIQAWVRAWNVDALIQLISTSSDRAYDRY